MRKFIGIGAKTQIQESLYDQLRELRELANREGLYDSADFLSNHIEEIERRLQY